MSNLEILGIDFGSHDGSDDSNLASYFLDDNYIENIVNGPIYFIIGRKGTGKSALFTWLNYKQKDEGYLCSNLSFNNFPSQSLLILNDEKYPSTSQYQNVWEYMILCELAMLIIKDEQAIESNPSYKELYSYIRFAFGDHITDLHRKVIQLTNKVNGELSVPKFSSYLGINLSREELAAKTYDTDNIKNIELVNRKLQDAIIQYLMNYPYKDGIKFLVQFDGLDDNYAVINQEKYFNAIISLFRCVYALNNSFSRHNLPAKILIYLRSDIYNSISSYDSDSAKWYPRKHDLKWAVINREDFSNGPLRKMINLRIEKSLKKKTSDPWSVIFNNEEIKLAIKKKNKFGKPEYQLIDVFQYIVNNTMHRPRDLVMFCIEIQKEAKKRRKLDYRTIKNAQREFSKWFWSEICNEINKIIPETDNVRQFLRYCGNQRLSVNEFNKMYDNFCKREFNFNMPSLDFLQKMYSFGLIVNVDNNGNFFSIIRNEDSSFNRNYSLKINQCLYYPIFMN